jgi:N-acetylneuraminic acid mutarotase
LPAAFGADLYTWQALPDLPEPLGVAGPCAGVSNGALVVAGGSRVFVLEDPNGPWRSAGTLEQPLARGASVTTPDGVICLGGSEAFRLRWINGRIEREQLPELPRPCADMSAAILGNTVYVAGGQALPEAASAMKYFWALDLARADPRWQVLEPWPGPARILPAAAVQDGAFYLIGGETSGRLLADAYRYRPGEGWKRIADVPQPVVAAPAIAEGQTHVMVFSREILAYHTITDTWAGMGAMPAGHAAATAVSWNGGVIIPGRRSPEIYAATCREPKSHFGALDYAAMGLYLLSLVLMGLYLSRRGKGTEDFFLAGHRIPWWAAGLSIYGTQLSSISFMAIPAKVYATDWVYLMANVAIVLIAPVVVYFYLPFFRRLHVTTAYEYLEKRFNLGVRLFASVAFIVYQLGRMAIVLFLPAIALSAVTGINVYSCILPSTP